MEGWLRCAIISAPPVLCIIFGYLDDAAPAMAQSFTAASLHGRVIEATVQSESRLRRDGGIEFTSPLTTDWRISIGADGKVTGTVTRSSVGRRGPISETQQFSATLGKPRDVRSGHSVMFLSGNTLTMLRTFDVGGTKATINSRGGGACSISALTMREVGAGPTKRSDALGGGTVEILSSRQISSSCQLR